MNRHVLTAIEHTEKEMDEFGKEHGFPVFFVVQQMENELGETDENKFKLTYFKNDQKHIAVQFAKKTGGEFGIFDPKNSPTGTKPPDNSIYRINGILVSSEQFYKSLEQSGLMVHNYEQAKFLNKHIPWQTSKDGSTKFSYHDGYTFSITKKT